MNEVNNVNTYARLVAKAGEVNARVAHGMFLNGYVYMCFTHDKITGENDVFYTKNAETVGPMLRELYPNCIVDAVRLDKIEW